MTNVNNTMDFEKLLCCLTWNLSLAGFPLQSVRGLTIMSMNQEDRRWGRASSTNQQFWTLWIDYTFNLKFQYLKKLICTIPTSVCSVQKILLRLSAWCSIVEVCTTKMDKPESLVGNYVDKILLLNNVIKCLTVTR